MLGAVIASGIVAVAIAVALVLVVVAHARERQHWADEREGLIDRIIAKHAGEVIAMDRASAPKAPRPEPAIRPVAEGL